MAELRDVCWRNGRGFSVADVTLRLESGCVTALMGANGAGKSTLLRLLTGELVPDSGEALLSGRPVRSIPGREFARQVAVIRQERGFAFSLTCRELVLTGRTPYLGFMGRTGAREDALAEDAMRRTGTLHLARAPFDQISGGEKQRVMLARALLQEPRVLLLDEAFSAMDARQAANAMSLVRALTREQGIAALCILHDVSIAHAFADRIVLMEQGRIVDDGPSAAVCMGGAMRRMTGMDVRVQPDGGLYLKWMEESME